MNRYIIQYDDQDKTYYIQDKTHQSHWMNTYQEIVDYSNGIDRRGSDHSIVNQATVDRAKEILLAIDEYHYNIEVAIVRIKIDTLRIKSKLKCRHRDKRKTYFAIHN